MFALSFVALSHCLRLSLCGSLSLPPSLSPYALCTHQVGQVLWYL